MNEIPKWLEEFGPFENPRSNIFRTKNIKLFNDIATKVLLITPGSYYEKESSSVFENVSNKQNKPLVIFINWEYLRPYIEINTKFTPK